MRKFKSISMAVVILIVTMAFLSACSSSVPNESKIKTDIAEHSLNFFSDTEIVDKVELVKRQTDKDKKLDIAWCKIDSHDDEAAYIKYFTLYYQLYDKGGWILEDLERDQKDKWSSTPLVGVKEDIIKDSLMGLPIKIDEEEWKVNEENIENITIDTRETQLELKKDIITATVKLNSDALLAQGQIKLEYTYNDEWKLKDSFVSTPFISEYKEQAKFVLANDVLISEIAKTPMVFKRDKIEQTISLTTDEISGFSILGSSVENKGTTQTVACSFTLNKALATFLVDTTIIYQYDALNGWAAQSTTLTPKVTTVNSQELVGNWLGKAAGSGFDMIPCAMEISDVKEDGVIVAIFSYPEEPCSFTATGIMNSNDLSVLFTFESWINQPRLWRSNYENNKYYAMLFVDSFTLNGKGYDAIEVTKTL